MRDIEFRGQAINRNRKWIYGDFKRYLLYEDGIPVYWIFPIDEEPGIDAHKIDVDTLGEYTGRKDKNRKKIFEGDKCKIVDDILSEVTVIVAWHHNSAGFRFIAQDFKSGFQDILNINSYKSEIIGNIHEKENKQDE